jgi:hypothetical protein
VRQREKPCGSSSHTLERVPINWNQLIGKTTLYFLELERLAFAQSGEKRSKVTIAVIAGILVGGHSAKVGV